MKIAISAVEPRENAEVDQRFGRAKFFAIYDEESCSWEFLDNKIQLNAVQGAGIQTAQTLSQAGVGVVLTGHCGPNAYKALSAAGIALYTSISGKIVDAVTAYKEGRFTPATGADVEGHW